MSRRVLIICTGNACRSQMAEALWNRLGAGTWAAFSAGVEPAGFVHPLAIAVMREIDVEIGNQRSKHVDALAGERFDLVVTVCDHAREVCPVLPEARELLHWPFEDPVGVRGSDEERLAAFRGVRDQIAARIRAYLGV